MFLETFMNMLSQLFDFPGSSCNPNDRHIEVIMPDHRLQGRKDLLIGQITCDAEKNECIRMACCVCHEAFPPVISACSTWPPNSKRMADINLSANSAPPRELKRSKSAELRTGTGTDSSMAALIVQRPSPES